MDDMEEVKAAVREVIAAGDFLLPNGAKPQDLLDEHEFLRTGIANLEGGQDKMLDILIGPVETDWQDIPDPDGRRDEDKGMQAQVARLDYHIQNGGVPVAIPTGIKAAIYGAAGAVVAGALTATAIVAAQFIG